MKIALSFLVVALAATPAAAQITGAVYAPARLKSQVTVSSDIVRIGDLIDNAGAAANTPIFRAPDLGQTGAVPVRAVLDAVRPYGLLAVDARGLNEIAVTHASRTIPADAIEQRIVTALTASTFACSRFPCCRLPNESWFGLPSCGAPEEGVSR